MAGPSQSRPIARPVNRRGFLKQSTAGGVAAVTGFWSGRSVAESKSPNEKLNVAFVGSGGQAGFSLQGLQDQNIVALCDVDQRRAAGAFNRYPKANKYRDFRKMLDQRHKQIDAVVVCTPDHVHAPLTEVMLLGCLAHRVGRNFRWDAAGMKATGCPEADEFIKRDYRNGWNVR